QTHGTKVQQQVSGQTHIHPRILPRAPAKKSFAMVIDRKPFDLDWAKTGGQTRGDLSPKPELIRLEAQRAPVFIIEPIIEGRCSARGLTNLELTIDTKPVTITGIVTRGTLEKFEVDEVGGDIAAMVEELKTRKIICQDVKVIPVAIAHDATTEAQARNERY